MPLRRHLLVRAMREKITALTPDDDNKLKLSKVKTTAAGIPAAMSSMKHGITRMGLAKTVKTLLMVNQQKGFDCPGCAWPDPSHRTTFEFCENGAKAVADEATKARVTPHFFSQYSIQQLSAKSDYWLNKQGRITNPMYLAKESSHYQEISWSDAFDKISSHLNALDDPNNAAFYTSGRTSNEAAFLYQAFVRAYGTNNLPDCSNMCHESSGKGLGSTIGIGKGTVTLEDFNDAELILVIGQNPGTNHPRMLTALRDAKHAGAKIVHINPLPESGLQRFKHPQDYMTANLKKTTLADIHLQVKIGGDAALLKGLIKIHHQNGGLDYEFIESKTAGYKAMLNSALETPWDVITRDSGLSKQQITEVGIICAKSKATIACWAMGLTQHRNGVAVIQEVVNLLLMGGHIGKKGAGLCPVRGHSNVQGDRTVGIWEAPSKEFLERLEQGLGFSVPSQHGYDVVNTIKAMQKGKISVFFCLGGNFISATPDTEASAEAMQKVGLSVQVSTKLNRAHCVTGEEALILPCLGRTELDISPKGEQFVSVENSMGIVHSSRGGLKPASKDLRSETWIVAQMANATLGSEHLNWLELVEDNDNIRTLMQRSLNGFEDYNKRIRQPNGFSLPNPPRDERSFATASGKAHFTTSSLPDVSIDSDKYVMMTIRSHDQYNTTIYDLHDRYRGIHGNRRVVMMNANDMIERGWKGRTIVDITSHFNGQTREAKKWIVVPYDIPSGNIATYFPEANCLIALDSTADISNTPTSKWVVVSLQENNSLQEEE